MRDTGGLCKTSVTRKWPRMFGWLGLSVGGAGYAGTLTSRTVITRCVPLVGPHELKR